MCHTCVHAGWWFVKHCSYFSSTLELFFFFFLSPCPSSSSTSSSLPSEWLSVVEGSSGSEAALGLKGTFQPGQTHSGLAAWLRNMGHRLTLGGPCQSQPSGALQHTWKWMNKVDVPLPTATKKKHVRLRDPVCNITWHQNEIWILQWCFS